MAELLLEPVDRLLDEACLAGGVEAELLGDLVAVDEVLGAQRECAQAVALEACGIHERSARVRRFQTQFEAEPGSCRTVHDRERYGFATVGDALL